MASSLEPAFIVPSMILGLSDQCGKPRSSTSNDSVASDALSTSAGSSPPTSPQEDSLEPSPKTSLGFGEQALHGSLQGALDLRSVLLDSPTTPARRQLSLDDCIEEPKLPPSPFDRFRAPPGLAEAERLAMPQRPGFRMPTTPGSLNAAAAAASAAAAAMTLAAQSAQAQRAQHAARTPATPKNALLGNGRGVTAASSPKKKQQVLCLAEVIEEQATSPIGTPAAVKPRLPTTTLAADAQHHSSGNCRPCAFFHRKGCSNGLECTFCHICGPGEKKRRQKDKLAGQRQRGDPSASP